MAFFILSNTKDVFFVHTVKVRGIQFCFGPHWCLCCGSANPKFDENCRRLANKKIMDNIYNILLSRLYVTPKMVREFILHLFNFIYLLISQSLNSFSQVALVC